MQTHTHEWTIADYEGPDLWNSRKPAWQCTTTVWWECRCAATAVHSHTFRPPSVESEQLESDA